MYQEVKTKICIYIYIYRYTLILEDICSVYTTNIGRMEGTKKGKREKKNNNIKIRKQ